MSSWNINHQNKIKIKKNNRQVKPNQQPNPTNSAQPNQRNSLIPVSRKDIKMCDLSRNTIKEDLQLKMNLRN